MSAPDTCDARTGAVEAVAGLLRAGGVVALTGAGISTESGIPDYRGPTGVARNASPMTFQEFTGSPEALTRYWARSFVGWPLIRSAQPNEGHRVLAEFERGGMLDAVITQNVDRLHVRAGSRAVVELHGVLDAVVCLACRDRSERDVLQARMAQANPGFDPSLFADADGDTADVRPDGDVALAEEMVRRFQVVPCRACGGGPLKPDVVFFGENVPRERVGRCIDLVGDASALVVLGSSLTVMSGYRFVRQAARAGIPVAILNQGATRGDDEASVRVDAPLGEALRAIRSLI